MLVLGPPFGDKKSSETNQSKIIPNVNMQIKIKRMPTVTIGDTYANQDSF